MTLPPPKKQHIAPKWRSHPPNNDTAGQVTQCCCQTNATNEPINPKILLPQPKQWWLHPNKDTTQPPDSFSKKTMMPKQMLPNSPKWRHRPPNKDTTGQAMQLCHQKNDANEPVTQKCCCRGQNNDGSAQTSGIFHHKKTTPKQMLPPLT